MNTCSDPDERSRSRRIDLRLVQPLLIERRLHVPLELAQDRRQIEAHAREGVEDVGELLRLEPLDIYDFHDEWLEDGEGPAHRERGQELERVTQGLGACARIRRDIFAEIYSPRDEFAER